MRWFPSRSSRRLERHPLANSALLEGLSARELDTVQGFLHLRDFIAGEVVFDEGEQGQALYLILSGKVSVRQTDGRVVATMEAGGFFGEMGLIDESPRSATIFAETDARLGLMFRGDFERLMDAHGRIASHIALQLARHLGQRLRDMMRRPTGVSGTP